MSMSGKDHGAMPGMGDATMGAMTTSGGGMATDINDIEYDAYLANDRTLEVPRRSRSSVAAGALAHHQCGGLDRFTIDLGALSGSLIAVDGHPIVPVTGRVSDRDGTTSRHPSGSAARWRGGADPGLARRRAATHRHRLAAARRSPCRQFRFLAIIAGPVLDLAWSKACKAWNLSRSVRSMDP